MGALPLPGACRTARALCCWWWLQAPAVGAVVVASCRTAVGHCPASSLHSGSGKPRRALAWPCLLALAQSSVVHSWSSGGGGGGQPCCESIASHTTAPAGHVLSGAVGWVSVTGTEGSPAPRTLVCSCQHSVQATRDKGDPVCPTKKLGSIVVGATEAFQIKERRGVCCCKKAPRTHEVEVSFVVRL